MCARGVARFSFGCAFCGLPSSCHFRESSRACLTRQRNTGAAEIRGRNMLGKGEAAILTSPQHMDYFRFEGGALDGAGVVVIAAGGGSGASAFFTESGSLSVLATNWAACQSCVSRSEEHT